MNDDRWWWRRLNNLWLIIETNGSSTVSIGMRMLALVLIVTGQLYDVLRLC